MADPRTAGRKAFRQYVTDGVPSSGQNKPLKREVLEFVDEVADAFTEALEAAEGASAGMVVAATWTALNANPGTRQGQPGRVTGPDAGTHTDPVVGGTKANIGEYAWSESPAGWQWLTDVVSFDPVTESTGADDAGKIPALDAMGEIDVSMVGYAVPSITDDYDDTGSLTDFAGNVAYFGDGGVYETADGDVVLGAVITLEAGDEDEEGLSFRDFAGNSYDPGDDGDSGAAVFATVSTYGSQYWDDPTIAAAKVVAETEVQRRMAQDLSGFTEWIAGYNGVSLEGQSFMQEDGTSGLFYTLARATKNNWQSLGLCVGAEPRPYAVSADYLPYGNSPSTTDPVKYKYEPGSGGASERSLNPIYESFVGGSNDDLIFTDAQAAIGNVPSNARSGDRSAVFAFVLTHLVQEYFGLSALPTDRNIVVMNKSKGGATLAEILGPGSDGLARFLHMHTVFNEAIAAGAHPAWAKQWFATIMCHGQADEASNTSGYAAALATAMDTTWTDIQSKTSQTKRPPWLMSQVGSDRGTAIMACARAQLAMSKDLTGTAAFAFLHRSTTEIPTLKDAAMPVETNNSHPILSGKVLAGIRDAIAVFTILIKREPYFIPYVQKYHRDGDIAYAAFASMTGNLKTSTLPYGCTQAFARHLGFCDQNAAGGDIDIPIDARIIPNTPIIEFRFARSKSGDRYLSCGANNGTSHLGQVYVRDTFDINQPITIPFDEKMRRWYNPNYGVGGDTGFGYLETAGAAGLKRAGYVNEVAGIVDCKIELGNPVARDIIASTPLE